MTSKHARFIISGEFITQRARDFWTVDEQPERAIELLEGIEGLSTAQRLDILEGRLKLEGDSSEGVTLAPDNAPGLSLKDALRKLAKAQKEAREDAADYVQMLNGDTEIVASPTGMREVPHRQTQASGGRAFPRQLKDGLDWKEVGGPETREPRVYREVERYPSQATRAAVDTLTEEKEEPPPPVPQAEDHITSDTGWLSPAGEFYGCLYGQHNNTAYALGFSPEDLSKNGWTRLQRYLGELMFFREEYGDVPVAQRKAIEDYCNKEKIKVPWWLSLGEKNAVTD